MFHVYVDPLFGDDGLAMAWNPNGTMLPTPPLPLSLHPHFDNDPSSPTWLQRPITGHLQHAPYPFRTLSGQNGALAYIASRIEPGFLACHQVPGSCNLPSISHVVVHCLPGLYGPRLSQPIDARSGLPFNGEQLPIVLANPRVSLQGTSALDTIFDARGTVTAILVIAGTLASTSGTDQDQFVDGIAFRNAAAGTVSGSGAGIWIRGATGDCFALAAAPTITNCFFSGNAVGLAIDSAAFVGPNCVQFANHRAIVFNNTFAWNSLGVWQGNLGAAVNPSLLAPRSVFANNLFALASPAGFPTALSCFEGVSSVQREVVLRGTSSLRDPLTSLGMDFNAFPDGRSSPNQTPACFNLGASIGSFLTAIPTSTPEVLARVDLLPFTPLPGSSFRSTLFVADALRNAPNGVRSDHDLRLSPNVGVPGVSGQPDPNLTNPCVNMGIDAGLSSLLDIRFNNTTLLCSGQLGLPSYAIQPSPACPGTVGPGDVEEAPISAWDFDAEGFGNDRIVDPSGFPASPDGHGSIDIGADELDQLILAGFVDGTRLFTGAVIPNAGAGLQDHTRVFFFGRIGTTMPRPLCNTSLGRLFPWYQHVQDGPGLVPPDRSPWPLPGGALGNFTDAAFFDVPFPVPPPLPCLRHYQIDPSSSSDPKRRPIPRNLECDFSPHLTADFHPLWGILTDFVDAVVPGDGYACNPWFDSANLGAPFVRLWNGQAPNSLCDNQFLYHNLGSVNGGHRTVLTIPNLSLLPATTFVVSGHLNPPLTFLPFALGQSWLIATFGVFPYGPFGTCTGPTLSFGAFGFNDQPGGCPDVIPEFPGEGNLGRRFNLEPNVAAGTRRNLQTYLQIFPTELPLGPSQESREALRMRTESGAHELRERIERRGGRQ